MKGIIETSVYLVIFALVCFFSIDFIRINQSVSVVFSQHHML